MLKSYTIAFTAALVTMLILDGLWLGTMLKRFYTPHLSHLLADKASLLPAVIFYLIYLCGVTVIIVMPALAAQHSLLKTFCMGALFGFTAYATYDLTNQATLKDWSTLLSCVDMAWGALLTGLVSTAAASSAKYFS